MEYLHAERLLHDDDVSRKPDCVRLLLSVDREELRQRNPSTPALVQQPEASYWASARGWLERLAGGTESLFTKLGESVRRLPCVFGMRGGKAPARRSGSLHEAFLPVLGKPQNYLDIISFLTNRGVDINTTDSKDGWALVHLCCLHNNARFLEHLLQNHGADPNLLSVEFDCQNELLGWMVD
jgi:hypothetical protein